MSSMSRILFLLCSHHSVIWSVYRILWGGGKLTEDLHFDCRLRLLVSIGSDTLVCPSTFRPGFIQREGGR